MIKKEINYQFIFVQQRVFYICFPRLLRGKEALVFFCVKNVFIFNSLRTWSPLQCNRYLLLLITFRLFAFWEKKVRRKNGVPVENLLAITSSDVITHFLPLLIFVFACFLAWRRLWVTFMRYLETHNLCLNED